VPNLKKCIFTYEEERKAEGYHAAVSANMNGLWTTKAFQDTFFHHPQFGRLFTP